MPDMRICVVSPLLGPALAAQGHEVVALWPAEPLFDLEAELAGRGFVPELILQQESLGQRVLLRGLTRFACPKVFWSLDTHLNLFWQCCYFRLFDGVLTPHGSLLQKAAPDLEQAVGRMAMFAPERPWRPFAKRPRGVGFVGRLTEHRPARRWLTEFLAERYGGELAQNLSFPQMLDFYQDTRLAPNESLLGEVNFRLMETAGCGCLVFSQDVGPDQDTLFTRGAEVETYANVLELRALLDHYHSRPEEAERLGRAAWERVGREHLLRHRAAHVVDFAQGLAPAAARGAMAEAAYWLSLARLARAGMLAADAQALDNALAQLPALPEVLAERLTLAVESGRAADALALARQVLAEDAHPGDLDVGLAGSMTGVLLEDWGLARSFWLRRQEAGRKAGGRAPLPADPARLCLAWAGELAQAERAGSAGFPFDPAAHLPKAAVECLYLAQRLAPDDLDITRRLAAMTSTLRGHDYARLGHLSTLALHNPGDWRTGLQLGMAGLKNCRLEAGLADLAQALEHARAQGKEAAFFGALAALDPAGHVLAALLGRRA
jgi:hypothetical protein